MQDLQGLIEELRQALNEEIEYIKQRGGGTTMRAKDGKLLESKGGKFLYQFIIDSPTSIPDDSPVEVRADDKVVRGYIVAIEGLKLTLVLEENLGERIIAAVITANPYYLLEIMNERLRQVTEGEVSINKELSQKVFGLLKSKSDEAQETAIQDYIVDRETKKRLNREQKSALLRSIGSEVTFIWGPPGTGKTFTLAKIAEYFFKQDLNVLVLSHTNIAIDNAVEKTARNLKENKDYLDGKVIRYGSPHLKNLFKNIREIDLDYWIEMKSKALVEERDKLAEEISKIDSELEEINRLLNTYRMISDQKEKTANDKAKLEKVEVEVEELEGQVKQKQKHLKEIKEKLSRAKTQGTIRRFFSGLNVERLETEKETTVSQLRDTKTRIKQALPEIEAFRKIFATDEKKLKELQSQLKSIAKPKRIPEEEELKRKASSLEEKRKPLTERIGEIDTRLSQLAEEILKEARLIATTLTKGYTTESIYSRNFDVVIVDEASMAPMPMLFFDSGLAKQKVIIIGDFRQLAPIAQADTPLVKKWLRRDIFDQSGITGNIDSGEEDERLVQLLEQHRMRPEISELSNKFIYNEKLRDAEKDTDEKRVEGYTLKTSPFSDEVVTICDTSNFNPWCAVTPDYSRFNIYSASLAVHLARQALDNNVEKIGIITPYAAQSKILAKMVQDEGLEEKLYDVSSVHRFQGREKELIIFDLAEGPGSPVSRLLSGKFGSDAMRLVNVAVTRARSKLIFLANIDHLLKKLGRDAIVRAVLEHAVKKHRVVSSSDFFEFIKASEGTLKEGKIVSGDAGRTIFYTQALFYDQFYQDLDRCTKELIIFSPFITRRRMDDVEQHLRKLVGQGVKVLIFTTPVAKQKSFFDEGKEEAVEYLKKAGIDVVFRYRTHEKLAVIDGNIVWQGSLNILSHKNTSELMGRWVGQRTAQELLRLLRVQRADRDAQLKKKTAGIKYGKCPKCGAPMVIKISRFGPFLACSRGFRVCKGAMDLDKVIIEKIYGADFMVCEKCGAEMKFISIPGRRKFLGCSKYPECKFTRALA